MTIPRLKWPLELADGHLATVEQDSGEDIYQCVLGVARTEQGQRPDLPDMHIPDLSFGEQPLEADELLEAIEPYEPRASLILEAGVDVLDQAVSDIRIQVAARNTEST